MMKSPKIEGEFTSPNQAAATVSIAKSNIKTPKSEMFDYSLSSDTKIGIKTFKPKMLNYRNPQSDSKSEIKNPKTEVIELPETSPILIISSDSEEEIKTPKSEMVDHYSLSKRVNDSLTPLKRRFYAISPIRIQIWCCEFKKCGVILDYVCQGNWMHILYQNQREAQKALGKSGKKISEVLIVGVNPVDPNKKQALNDRKPSLSGDRVRKALHESICLLHRSEGKFFVLAATGNVYTVTLSTTPVCRCNCPDSVVPCKHILFVFLRVLGISQNDRRLCRKRLKPCQLADLLKMPSSAETLASESWSSPSIDKDVACAICHAKWHYLGDYEMVKCGSCGDIGHKTCLVTYRRSRGVAVRKCKSCRTNWVAAVQNWYTKLTR
ncbi:hypothetical protein MKW92_022104 [Papaver armeniacum]|nr:hypothetical protein MKW92_022104 [Papaver armeniacum]